MIDFTWSISPNTSIVEVSLNGGATWINATNTIADTFVYSVNATELSEGALSVWLNVTISPGVSLIRTYDYLIDRSFPQITFVSQVSVISETGYEVFTIISDAVITANTTVNLYHTYDNSTWYQTQMSLINQTISNATYSAWLPPVFGPNAISYYVQVV